MPPATLRRARFAYLESYEASDAGALLEPGGALRWKLLPAGKPLQESGGAALRGWKSLCDVLLPALRPCSHLHNLIHRHRTSCSLVLLQGGAVVAGATYRLLLDREPPAWTPTGESSRLILEVLLLAVEQRRGVCGRGHGTRVVNSLKALLLRRAAAIGGCRALLLTQADLGDQARFVR